MELICIDQKYPEEAILVYKKYGVSVPQENSLYTIRQVIKHTTGKTGILLEELHNPMVPYFHPVLGQSTREPDFNIKRFAHLDMTPILEEELSLSKLTPKGCINYNLVDNLEEN